ncbi:MAG TPA: PAS domain S-box protein [Longimicrobium sp.]|nr:PAS domain S-box protein [Longimicrobium sp.]
MTTRQTARAKHLEDALAVAEERFFATFELAPAGIAHVAPDGRWLRVNRRLCNILGFEPGELLRLRVQDLTHPEDLAADLDQALRTVAGEQSSYTIEKRYIRKDGTSIWAEVRVALVRELPSEKPLYFVAVVDDITAQRQAEEASERSARELATLLAGLPDIIARFDTEGRHLYVNPTVERATGLAASEFIGRTNRELGMPLELVEQWEAALAEVVATGTPREESFTFPTPEGGRRYWSLMVPEHDTRGAVTGVLSVCRDVSGVALDLPADCVRRLQQATADDFRDIFERAGVGLAEVGLDGRLLRVNHRLCEILHRTRDELMGLRFQDITDPADLDEDLARLERLVRGETTGYSMEKRYLRPGGEPVWAELTVALLRGPEGEIRHFVSVVQGIQARKDAEARLAESEARLRFLAELIPQLVWSTRPDGYHDYYNARWFEYTGLTYEDTQGPGWNAVLHPDDRERAWNRWEHSLRTGEPYAIEYRFRRHDGAYRWFLGLAMPLRGPAGQIERWFGTCTDIQEQKDAERTLHEMQERMQAALDASATGTFRWNIRTGRLDWDAALDRLFGLPPQASPRSLEGFLVCVHPDDRARVAAAAERCARVGGGFTEEFRVVWPDSTVRWLLDKGDTTPGPDGRPLYMTGACVDITERKDAELEREALLAAAQSARGDAETASHLKSQFVATMSHEVRTPINAVLGYADLLDLGVHGPLNDAQREQVRRILRSARHLLSLVNDSLDMAKIEAGEMQVLREAVDVRELCRSSLEMAEALAAARNVALRDETGSLAGAWAWGDEDRVRQVLVNLLTNACKFTPPGGTVRICRARGAGPPDAADGRWVGVEVADTGPGIALEMQERVFLPFVQGHAPAPGGARGTGLGLPISRTLARLMGGDVVLRTAPGAGSSFTLWLPGAPANAAGG